MKNMKTRLALLLASFGLAFTVQAGESLSNIAESDQIQIGAFVNRHYAPFVENYLTVFSGHFRCDYDFIDEAEFDELAEDAVTSLSTSIGILLSERMQSNQTPLSESQLDYVSALVAMSFIDAQAERYTAVLNGEYDAGTTDCTTAREANQAIYNGLPASLAALQGLKIPGD